LIIFDNVIEVFREFSETNALILQLVVETVIDAIILNKWLDAASMLSLFEIGD